MVFGSKKVVQVRDPKKTVVVGLFERAEGLLVRFGVGELIEDEVLGKKEKSFRVRWDDGTTTLYPPPPYGSVFFRDGGGSVVFYYIQAPDVAVPLSTPKDAIRRLKFSTKEDAERVAAIIKQYNPKMSVEVDKTDEGYYVVEFPVITFDLNRDVPIREHYTKIVLRLVNKSLKKGWWERYGNIVVIGGALLIMILAFLLASGFVQQTVEVAVKNMDKVATVLEKVATQLGNVLETSNRLLEASNKLLEMTAGGATRVPPPPPG